MDRDLTPEEAHHLRQLLSSDPEAREELQGFERLESALKRWGASEPDLDWGLFHSGVLREIQRTQAKRRSASMRVYRIGLPLAAAASVLMALWMPMRNAGVEPRGGGGWANRAPWIIAQFDRPEPGRPEAGHSADIRVQIARLPVTASPDIVSQKVIYGSISLADESLTETPQVSEWWGTH